MVRLIENLYTSAFGRVVATLLLVSLLAGTGSSLRAETPGQEKKPESPAPQRKEDGKVPNEKELEKDRKKQEKAGELKLSPVETVVELAILAYGGRKQLQTVRSSIQEEGTIRLATETGDISGKYNLRSTRKEKSWQDLLRVDLDLTTPEAAQRQGAASSIKYVMAYNGASVWSAQNNQYLSPRPEAEASFRAQLTHEYTTLLRYKEDGSKIELIGPETVVGVETNVVEMTTPDGEKTRYWISSRTYRILHAEYELKLGDAQPTKFRVSYYYVPFRVVQNTLVPSRRLMTQNGKFVQEINLTNMTYSAKLDPEIFQHLQE